MLRGCVLKRISKVDHATDEVEQTAAVLEAAHDWALEAFRVAMCSGSSAAFLMPARGERSPSSG